MGGFHGHLTAMVLLCWQCCIARIRIRKYVEHVGTKYWFLSWVKYGEATRWKARPASNLNCTSCLSSFTRFRPRFLDSILDFGARAQNNLYELGLPPGWSNYRQDEPKQLAIHTPAKLYGRSGNQNPAIMFAPRNTRARLRHQPAIQTARDTASLVALPGLSLITKGRDPWVVVAQSIRVFSSTP